MENVYIILCDIFIPFQLLLMILFIDKKVELGSRGIQNFYDNINFPIKGYGVGVKNRVGRGTVNTLFWGALS
jgi:hypothetical protein